MPYLPVSSDKPEHSNHDQQNSAKDTCRKLQKVAKLLNLNKDETATIKQVDAPKRAVVHGFPLAPNKFVELL